MATTQNEAGLPQITLTQGMILRFNAISATTGAAVTGVTVSNVSIYGETRGATADPTPIQLLPPLLVHEPQAGTEAPGLTR